MSNLENYFEADESKREWHPLLRLFDTRRQKDEFSVAKVRIDRPRAALGFEPAMISLEFFNKKNELLDYKIEPWDADLNKALVNRSIRAINESNEIERFGLGLRDTLQHPESRYGDGYFRSVLMVYIDASPFADMPPIKKLRPCISTMKPYQGNHAAEDCQIMIQTGLQDHWLRLRRSLQYSKTEAESILAGALAYYLDEVFGITDGIKLGWLKGK
ncbi:hypothetical protein [Gimesia chilikensis]|uniref:hypothetical protein n=1 Tax=Gimesia chilikensis TaxID=2605989 RepID=UPI003A932504